MKFKLSSRTKSHEKENSQPKHQKSKEKSGTYQRGKPKSSIVTSIDEFKRKIGSKGKPSTFQQSRNSVATSADRDKLPPNSKFLNAMKKRGKKIDNVVQAIRYDSKQMKLRMLGLYGKTNYVDYGEGFREMNPEGYENKECWMTDLSEDEDSDGAKKGLLPLRSEIDYKRRKQNKEA